ncbi:MAG: hypothetical protein AB7U20_06710 [Planctomycetaceae bacterium]
MKPDPPIDEIRAIRHQISAEHGHDPRRLVEHYRKLQEKYKDRLISPGREEPPANEVSAEEEVPAAAEQ